MKRQMKLEFKKAFSSMPYKLALLVNLLICLWQNVENYISTNEIIQLNSENNNGGHRGFYEIDLFSHWIGVDGYLMSSAVFFSLLSLTAAIAFGYSYLKERNTGYYLHMIHRNSKKKYLISKYAAGFICGGFSVAFPMLINFMINAMINPAGMINVNTWITPTQPFFFSELFYTCPLLYVLLVLIMDFIWGGICTALALSFSLFVKNIIIVLVMPAIFFHALDLILGLVRNNIDRLPYEISPLKLMMAVTLSPNPSWLVFSLQICFIIVTFTIFVLRGSRVENL